MRRVALALLAAAFAVTLVPGPWGDERVSDLFLYRSYAAAFLDGSLPFRDVAFEYPPLAAPVIALPGLVGTGEEAYRLTFALLTLGVAGGVVLLCGALSARTGGDRGTAMVAAALTPLLTGAVLRTHFDLVPVALTLGSLLLVVAGRPRTGFLVLGIGVMTKGFPLVVAPVALAWLLARGERRAALASAAVLLLCTGLIACAALAASPSGALDAVGYHLDRPVQLESGPASVILALDAVGAGEARSVHSHRSDGLLHPLDGPLSAAFGVLLLSAVALFAAAATPFSLHSAGASHSSRAGGMGPERALVLGSLAATAAFAALGKVLSPQFLIWVAPLMALALSWRMWTLAAACACAIALTLVEFPAHYADVVAREPLWLSVVAARNLVLLGAVALALRALTASATEAAAARSRWPALPHRRPPAPR